MALDRELLRRVPHAAFSRTEDLEFGVLLGLRGVRVAFAGETCVYGEMPEQQAAVAGQRERWIGGRAAIARRFAGTLLHRALQRRSLMLADLACDLLLPPLSALTVVSGAGLSASLALAVLAGSSVLPALIWSIACAGLGMHVTHAACLAGQFRAFILAAGSLPRYALGRTITAMRSLRPSEETWIRTPRVGDLP